MQRPDNNPFHEFLDRRSMRSSLTDEEQEAILALPTLRVQVSARRDIAKMDEATSYASLIVTGMVGRFSLTDEGARQFTAFHIPGDMADLHSVVRPVGVGGLNALSDTIIMRVPHDAIRALTARYPAIAEAFWRDCMFDAAILNQWVVNVGRRDARTRIAHLLCEMATRFGNDREIVQDYALPVTQEQLGDATALTAVHVNRTLKTLTTLATIGHGRAVIHDWAELARVGSFDAAYLVADTLPGRHERVLEVA